MGEIKSFHPLEVAFCGYSGTGKSTLISKIIPLLDLQVAFVKHDVHRFTMDHPGKDTYEVKKAGAAAVFISNDQDLALLKGRPLDPHLQPLDFLEYDGVIVEGHKRSALPKILVLDPGLEILRNPAFADQTPLAAVGPWTQAPALPWEVPYFHRDDVSGVAALIRDRWASQARERPVFGLVLSGGKSTRMGTDKGALEYAGKPQIPRTVDLLTPFCSQVFVSCRPDQTQDPHRRNYPQVVDRFLDFGPLSGILSAQFQHPEATWLVAAVDLPFLDRPALEGLFSGRNPFRFATAYRGFEDLPEPLCALYEPKSRPRLLQFLAQGYQCPRKMLINSPIALLESPGRALDNVNNPQEREKALHDIRS